MDVDLIKKQLFWELYSAKEDFKNKNTIDLTKVCKETWRLIVSLEVFRFLLENKSSLSDRSLIKKLLYFGYISDWNEIDCFNVIKLKYDFKYIGYDQIKTSMIQTMQKSKGTGRDYSHYRENSSVLFNVLYTKDFMIDYNHRYTIDEIKKLLKEKKIFIISREEEKLSCEEDYKKEPYYPFEEAYNKYSMEYEFLNPRGKFYFYTLKYIKKKITYKRLRELFNEQYEHVINEINEATNEQNKSDCYFNHICYCCSIVFERKGYIQRLEKIKNYKLERNI